MTDDEKRTQAAQLAREVRRLAMRFAIIDPEELQALEALALRSSGVAWLFPTADDGPKATTIARHVELVQASVRYAREVRKIIDEEIAERSRHDH
jgi:hypothetical protein